MYSNLKKDTDTVEYIPHTNFDTLKFIINKNLKYKNLLKWRRDFKS